MKLSEYFVIENDNIHEISQKTAKVQNASDAHFFFDESLLVEQEIP